MAAETAPAATRLADYQPPDYVVREIALDFQLDPKRTFVRARLDIHRAPSAPEGAPLVLNGENLELLSILINDVAPDESRLRRTADKLIIDNMPAAAIVETSVAISPEENSALSGLYLSSGMLCTQCEAEGFRRITFFPDRPDILARYKVRLEGDQKRYPALLSNGNRISAGALADGRHYAEWEDPFPKPSYLFALVAGDLVAAEDAFVTRSGRRVALKVFVQPQNIDKCGYTIESLKRAMRWDEEAFGREYDLDVFMIVAVDHFNFGAMENKGLNIFNSAYVLASPETATDADYEAIESIVAHEYFHNWSGNRVTCRDWFQLCLKEGFTVFRDQEFSADMRSRGVKRIKDVRRLWAQQFPEDAGPLAHSVRPESYISIDNFYTATIYEKGAEICRMLKTLLGEARFRRGSDLYFERHDGSAATVEDFIRAMEDASGARLDQFRLWYSDAGTPEISAEEKYEASGAYALTLRQSTRPTPGQPTKRPRDIPVRLALIGATTGAILKEDVVRLTEATTTVSFGPFRERPVASLLRGFSAPATANQALGIDDRLTIARAETDPFARWSAIDKLWRDLSLAFADAQDLPEKERALEKLAEALSAALNREDGDLAMTAELLKAPTEAELAQYVTTIDPAKITAGRQRVREAIATALKPQLKDLYFSLTDNAPFEPSASAAARRALRNASLSMLVAAGAYDFADAQARSATNMTDEAAAVLALATSRAPERKDALARFYEKWRRDPLVVNKWLAWNALGPADTALADVAALARHEAFDAKVPNKVRALLGAFAAQNLAGFHRADGEGYNFFTGQVLAIDQFNPQLAARLIASMESWRKLEPLRRARAELALRGMSSAKQVSPNLFEMLERLLAEPQKSR